MRKSYLVYSRIKFGSGNGLVPAKFWERAKQFIVIVGNWRTPSHGIRELIQRRRRRRRQRARQKTNRFRLEKQQLCTCIKLFCAFLCRRCTTTAWKRPDFTFCRGRGNTRQQLWFSFPEPQYNRLEFSSKEICRHLTNWTSWNKRD